MADTLPAPVPGDDPIDETVTTITANVAATSGSDDQSKMDKSFNATVRALREQQLVRVRVPEGGLYVQINGWKSSYAQGVHMVPEQVAQIWMDAGRI